MSAGESGRRGEVRQTEGGGRSRPVEQAFAWIAYLAGASGVLLFGSEGFAVAPIAGYGLMLAVAGCLCWAVGADDAGYRDVHHRRAVFLH